MLCFVEGLVENFHNNFIREGHDYWTHVTHTKTIDEEIYTHITGLVST